MGGLEADRDAAAGEVRVRNVELTANFIYFLCAIWPLRFWSIGKYVKEPVANDIIDFVFNGLGVAMRSDAS